MTKAWKHSEQRLQDYSVNLAIGFVVFDILSVAVFLYPGQIHSHSYKHLYSRSVSPFSSVHLAQENQRFVSLVCSPSFQAHTCLFLHASDIISFTEALHSASSRDTRRLDELLAAQVIEKPIIIIDDLSDVDDQSFDSVLNLLQNTLARETSTDVRFVLVAHLDAERSVYDKIAARFGAGLPIDVVRLPQLPIKDLQSSNALPGEVASLVQRAAEFGPALNLKLLDWLVSSVQRDGIKASAFRNDLDLLAWFWRYHIGNGRDVSEEGCLLIGTAISLADKFTPDLSLYDSPVDTKTLSEPRESLRTPRL